MKISPPLELVSHAEICETFKPVSSNWLSSLGRRFSLYKNEFLSSGCLEEGVCFIKSECLLRGKSEEITLEGRSYLVVSYPLYRQRYVVMSECGKICSVSPDEGYLGWDFSSYSSMYWFAVAYDYCEKHNKPKMVRSYFQRIDPEAYAVPDHGMHGVCYELEEGLF